MRAAVSAITGTLRKGIVRGVMMSPGATALARGAPR